MRNLEKLREYGEFFPVLKSNAYGLGIEIIAEMCLDFELSTFFVRNAHEASRIHKLHHNSKIITLNGPENIEYTNNLMPAVINIDQLKYISEQNKNYWIHFDIGINRTGILIEDYEKIKQYKPEGIIAHYSISQAFNNTIAQAEYNRARQIFNKYDCIKSLSKSNMIRYDSEFINRPGFGIYTFDIRAVEIFAQVIDIKTVRSGDYIGYDSTYLAKSTMQIAIVNCGYANGFNMTSIYIENEECARVGKISMELSIFDISHISSKVSIGSIAEVKNYTHIDLYNICTNNNINWK